MGADVQTMAHDSYSVLDKGGYNLEGTAATSFQSSLTAPTEAFFV